MPLRRAHLDPQILRVRDGDRVKGEQRRGLGLVKEIVSRCNREAKQAEQCDSVFFISYLVPPSVVMLGAKEVRLRQEMLQEVLGRKAVR